MLSSILLAAAAAIPALASAIQRDTPNCFPYGSAKFPGNLEAPGVSRDQWWCPQSMAYGFQGFSYPLENGDCSAWENGYDAMDKDFKQMKKDFGASIVRMYYPVCTKTAVFEHALEAAYNNNMAVVFQVWTNFGDGDVWKQSQQAIYDVLSNPKYKAIAPYVVHSAEFGSEPVGDGMDGDNLVSDLGKFRKALNAHQIPVGISEDWDRPGTMSSSDGQKLGPVGAGVKASSDVAHIHPMPFYHDYKGGVDAAWPYIQRQTQWVVDRVGLPTVISETQWAWGRTEHNPGKADVGPAQYVKYWKTIDGNCEWFKERKVGWFFHAWRGEDTFDIVKPDGSYAIPNWRPRRC